MPGRARLPAALLCRTLAPRVKTESEKIDPAAGAAMHAFVRELFPIGRSLTGQGVRETLSRIASHIPLEISEVPSGTPAFDWTVPREWIMREGWIRDPAGRTVVDYRASNLHVVGYSRPVRARLPLAELRKHLHSMPGHPDRVPYRTTYYADDWGFCLAHRHLESLADGEYEVCIDADLKDGSLTYGECVLAGESTDEALISTHLCHPSLANDNLSGIAVATWLASRLGAVSRRLTYRFLFIPGTIGSIVWLAQQEHGAVPRVRHGLVLAGVGDAGPLTYKKTRAGDAPIDRAVQCALRHHGGAFHVRDFIPYGYDERQFNSPGFALPVGCLMRTPFGEYPEYHSSADNVDFVKPEALADTLALLDGVVEILEHDRTYRNLHPKCEPQLGRRGLYAHLGGQNEAARAQLAMLWVLNLADGSRSLLDIAERCGLSFPALREAAGRLEDAGLLEGV